MQTYLSPGLQVKTGTGWWDCFPVECTDMDVNFLTLFTYPGEIYAEKLT